jgi:hypothetical protein
MLIMMLHRFLNRDLVAKRLEEEGQSKEVVEKVRTANFPLARKKMSLGAQ